MHSALTKWGAEEAEGFWLFGRIDIMIQRLAGFYLESGRMKGKGFFGLVFKVLIRRIGAKKKSLNFLNILFGG